MHQGKKKRTARQEQIQKILEELKGTKNISSVKSAQKKRILIPKIKNMKVETITARKGIANVFAEFYAKLYEDDEGEENKRENEAETCSGSQEKYLGTSNQFRSSQQMKSKMRAGDSSGVRAEQIKNCSDETKERIRQIFNEILLQKQCTPKTWRRIRVQVIHKKRVTKKMRAITGLSAHYLYYTKCLPRSCTHDSLHPCTKCSHSTRVAFGPSFDGVQSIRTALSGVGCTAVHLDNRLHEGFLPNKTFGPVDVTRTLRNRTFVRGTSEAALQKERS